MSTNPSQSDIDRAKERARASSAKARVRMIDGIVWVGGRVRPDLRKRLGQSGRCFPTRAR
jgi:hypothetical protein